MRGRRNTTGSAPQYDEPFHWWGPGWHGRPWPTVQELLRDGAIEPRLGAILWAALARRSSLVVLAGPSGAGKTTLLSALLEFVPPFTQRIYVRGCYETFAYARDPAVVPEKSVLLVNEISPHLPVYLWGPAVRRVLDEAKRGYMIMATAHAATVPEFVGALTGSPLRIPASSIAAFGLAVLLGPGEERDYPPRITSVWQLRPTRDGISVAAVGSDISQEPTDFAPGPVPCIELAELAELKEREYHLQALRDGRTERLPLIRVPSP